MIIYLIRHGETEWNKIKRIQGNLDIPLNDLGRAQATQIINLVSNISFDSIYTSELIRAIETADILFPQYKNKIKCADLNERNFGDWQGTLWSEVYASNPKLQQEWQQQGGDYRPPNGESLSEMISRSFHCFETIVKKHKISDSIAIVGHGGPIKSILGKIEGIDDDLIPNRHSIGNCNISKINYDIHFSIKYINHETSR